MTQPIVWRKWKALNNRTSSVPGVNAKHLGALAESIASDWLLRQGYEVFRNISSHGIADLVAWKPGTVPIMIDVKSVSKHRGGMYFQRLTKEQFDAGVKLLHIDCAERTVHFHPEDFPSGFVSHSETIRGNGDLPQGAEHDDADGSRGHV